MVNKNKQELTDRKFALMREIAPTVVEHVMRDVSWNDVCGIDDDDKPDWIRGTAIIVKKLTEAMLANQEVNHNESMVIILDGMPQLEWMTENLTGHGGTEIDGNWYYTWEQAMAAAKELGDGWRLPTREDFEKLCDAGSTWVDKGPDGMPGRWFGGNHDTDHIGSLFFPAAGCLSNSSGAVTDVASGGYYWSSSPYSGGVSAGYLYFGSGGVYPLNGNHRANGFSVRCVREL